MNVDYGIPFIFLTANSNLTTVNRAKEVKPYAYLVNPFNESQAEFRAHFQFATIGILVIVERGTIEPVNLNAEKLFGYSNAKVIDKTIEILIPENLAESHHHHCNTYFGKPKSRPMGLGMELRGRK